MKTKPPKRILYAAVALPAAILVTSPAWADCSAGDTSGCATLPELSQDLLQGRADRTIATDPSQDMIAKRLDQKPWAATGTAVPSPLTVSSDGSDLQTSLTNWGSSLSASERKRLEAIAKKDKTLKVPTAIEHRPAPFNVWIDTRHQALAANSTDALQQGQATTTYAGADYRWNHRFLLGGMVQVDSAEQNPTVGGNGISGKAYMAGPYAAYRLTSNVIIDGKATWGQSADTIHLGDQATDFSTDRSLAEARISGSWKLNRWQLTPSGAITHVSEDANQVIPGGTNVRETRISIRPELKRPIDMANGNKLAPFAYVQSSLSLNNSDPADSAPQNSVGGGLTLTTTRKYNITASAEYTQTMDNTTPPDVSGHFSLNVPFGAK